MCTPMYTDFIATMLNTVFTIFKRLKKILNEKYCKEEKNEQIIYRNYSTEFLLF